MSVCVRLQRKPAESKKEERRLLLFLFDSGLLLQSCTPCGGFDQRPLAAAMYIFAGGFAAARCSNLFGVWRSARGALPNSE
jgi:hypothetical protein